MSLWTPQPETSEITSTIELYDSDIRAISRGPMAWGREQYGKTLDIDQFTRDLTEQFTKIGLGVDVQVWQTNQEGTWIFQAEINSRFTAFDPDRQVHEVVSDLLDLGEGGWIDTAAAAREFDRRRREGEFKHPPPPS